MKIMLIIKLIFETFICFNLKKYLKSISIGFKCDNKKHRLISSRKFGAMLKKTARIPVRFATITF